MMTACLICLAEVGRDTDYHPPCVRRLFGTRKVPRLEIALAKLHTFGLAMVGRTSISGVQRKISLGLGADRMTLQVGADRARYILKPATEVYPSLPENEHVTMRIAKLCRIAIPECGLIRLEDGSLAYIVVRFDRPAEGGKLRQEDFCQLALKSPKQKYEGSAERCARLLRRYASEPVVEQLKLFRLMVFAWWTGNGDMHLKNFSLLADLDGRHHLSPAYDLVCTRLLIQDDPLALPVGGKDRGITRKTWLEYGEYCELPRPAIDREFAAIAAAVAPARRLLGQSLLPDEMKQRYSTLLEARAGILSPRGQ